MKSEPMQGDVEMEDKKKILVIYHGPGCVDGFTAAWVCWLKFGDSAEYVPAKYGDTPPDCAGRDVYIVDFSYPLATVNALRASAASLTIFDHHKTAEEDLSLMKFSPGLPEWCRTQIVFDMERSGAGITWDMLHQIDSPGRPWLVNYVEDRDLWRFALPDSKAVSEYLRVQDHDFEHWSKVLQLGPDVCAMVGKHLIRATNHYVEQMKQHARSAFLCPEPRDVTDAEAAVLTRLGDQRVLVVNAPPHAISELLHTLVDGDVNEPFVVGWFQRGDGKYQYSLRSGPHGADVSEIARLWPGGGGHKHAAGFTVDERVDF